MCYFIIIRGPLGCGKSTIARKLSDILSATHFSIDTVLEKNNLIDDREEGYISQKSFLKANEVILPSVKQSLRQNRPVIFDGNFYWKSSIEDLKEKLNVPSYVFTLKVPLEVCLKRDKERSKSYGSDACSVVYNKTTEFDYGAIIDATKSEEEVLKEIITLLPKL